MSKKILSAVLAVMMVLTMFPMAAFATETPPAGEPAWDEVDYTIADVGFAYDIATIKEATGLLDNNVREDTMWVKFDNATKPANETNFWITIDAPNGKSLGLAAVGTGTSNCFSWSFLNDPSQFEYAPDFDGKIDSLGVGEYTVSVYASKELQTTTTTKPDITDTTKFKPLATKKVTVGPRVTNVKAFTVYDATSYELLPESYKAEYPLADHPEAVATFPWLVVTYSRNSAKTVNYSVKKGEATLTPSDGTSSPATVNKDAYQMWCLKEHLGQTADPSGEYTVSLSVADVEEPFVSNVAALSYPDGNPLTRVTSETNIGAESGDVTITVKGNTIYFAGAVAGDGWTGLLCANDSDYAFAMPTIAADANGDFSITPTNVNYNRNTNYKFDVSGLYLPGESDATGDVAAPAVKEPEGLTGTDATLVNSVVEALKDSTKTEFQEEVLAAAADKKANSTTVETSEVETALEEADITGSTLETANAEDLNIVVQTYMEISIKSVDSESETQGTIEFNIQPMARTIATTVDLNNGESNTGIKVAGDEGVNADEATAVVVKDEKIQIDAPTEVSLNLPAGFIDTLTCLVKHIKDTGKTYYYTGTVDENVLTFTSQHGFSSFVIPCNETMKAQIGTTQYASLDAALDDVEDGQTIILLEDDLEGTINKPVNFYVVSTDGQDYTATITAGTNVNVRSDGNHYFVTVKDINHPQGPGTPGAVTSTITVTKPENGTLTTSANAAKEGDTVTVTATANTGYVVAGVTVTDASGNNVAVSGSNGTYTFTMPKTAVTVTANIVTLFSQFTDVPANEYYADAVKWAVENGITLGTSATTFSPGNPCSRKEMVLFLYRVKGKPAVNGTPSFTDVSGTAYDAYRDAIKWAVDSGITKGTGDGTTFEPDKACSRSEMVTFLHRLNGTPAVTGTNGFVDVASDAYFKDAVQWAATNGITVGAGSADIFNPFGVCSRGEMALFLQRNSKL